MPGWREHRCFRQPQLEKKCTQQLVASSNIQLLPAAATAAACIASSRQRYLPAACGKSLWIAVSQGVLGALPMISTNLLDACFAGTMAASR